MAVLISLQGKFVFIHIPKSAGLSIHRALADVTPDAMKRIDELPACREPLKNRHLFASDLKNYLGDATWSTLFSFGFVRNPWARLVSWYNMCIERPSTPFMHMVKKDARSFSDFLFLTEGRAAKTTFNQVDYLCDENGKLLVNFVGRFENVTSDFGRVCGRLGIRLALPHINKTSPADYRAFYTARTRCLVEERFRRDVETFGYNFDGG